MPAIVNRANTAVTALGDGRYRIEKTGGASDAFDASAISTARIAGDFVLWARSVGAPMSGFVAATADPLESDGFTTLDYAAQIHHAALNIFERGVFRPPVVAHDGAVWIVRTGGTLSYRTGAVLATSTLQRSVGGVTAPLYFDSAIETTGGVLEVRFAAAGGSARRARRATLGITLQAGGAA